MTELCQQITFRYHGPIDPTGDIIDNILVPNSLAGRTALINKYKLDTFFTTSHSYHWLAGVASFGVTLNGG